MTWGEAVTAIQARRERERRRAQALSLIAWEQAALTARAVVSGSLPEVYECFPFWTQEECIQLRVEKYRAMLEGMAAGKRGGKDEREGESRPR
jgi:hypothetical protein